MRLGFMGSPDFAVPALRRLVDAGHAVEVVYCQPPKPAGRGRHVMRCAVHEAAVALGIPVRTPGRLRGNAAEVAQIRALDLDAGVVAAYGLILPPEVLDAPRRGWLNIHASLLPRWRGAAPIQAAVLAGDSETGITIMQMDEGLDTGPILLAGSVPIGAAETSAAVHDRLAVLGAALIVRVLDDPPHAVPQPGGSTYAPKLTKADALIDWSAPAPAIERRVRAFTPWPGTETRLAGAGLKIHAAILAAGNGAPGTVLDDRLTIACGSGAVRLVSVQRPGRAAMDADAFLRGQTVPPGTVLG